MDFYMAREMDFYMALEISVLNYTRTFCVKEKWKLERIKLISKMLLANVHNLYFVNFLHSGLRDLFANYTELFLKS